MKTKLSPRHIIPVVCYASYIVGALALAITSYIDKQNYTVPENVGDTLPGMELIATGLVTLAFYFAMILALLIVLFASMPLTFSAINIKKKNRKLAMACLIFDILATQICLLCSLLFLSKDTLSTVLIFLVALGISISALVANIFNIQKNIPAPTLTAET